MKKYIFLSILFLIVSQVTFSENPQRVQVIPYPATCHLSGGTFILKKNLIAVTSEGIDNEASFLARAMGSDFGIRKKTEMGCIVLKINSQVKIPEGYRLVISKNHILIEGNDAAGLFYGIQTFLQIRDSQPTKNSFPRLEITDAPRYAWRGFMVDESRHFFGKEKIKQLLDVMAMLKLNKFHWHLTDSPGWRIEILKYPLLTSVGSIGSWSNIEQPSAFYTQDDIREIVRYASERHIEIIPEIDMPGHASAANRAYPEFGEPSTSKRSAYSFNPANEGTYSFLTDILREVAALFPSKYIHLGGDEVSSSYKTWEADCSIQSLMKREGLKNAHEVENYFNRRMADSLRSLGKKLIGWDEMVDSNTDPNQTSIMWWRHDKVAYLQKSLAKGFQTILCPRIPLYFDFVQEKGQKEGRTDGVCRLEDVYGFPDTNFPRWNFSPAEIKSIAGIQANLWTERIQNSRRFDYLTYPRIVALGESAWTLPANKNFDDFQLRLNRFYNLFHSIGLVYFDHRNPQSTPEEKGCEMDKRWK